MTKSQHILALYAQGKTTREIALEVYGEATRTNMAYVRVVARQRRGASSAADVKWHLTHFGGETLAESIRLRRASDPVFRNAMRRNVMRNYYANREEILANKKERRRNLARAEP